MNFGRIYYLTIANFCKKKCDFCPGLGAIAGTYKLEKDIESEIKKLKLSGYQSIMISCADNVPLIIKYIPLIQSEGIEVIIQTNRYDLLSWSTEDLNFIRKTNSKFCITFGDSQDIHPEIFKYHLSNRNYIFLMVPTKSTIDWQFKYWESTDLDQLYFYFPIKQNKEDIFLGPQEVYSVTKKIKDQGYLKNIRTLSGLDQFNPKNAANSDLEPQIKPRFQQIKNLETPKVSIIIPTYNKSEILIQSLLVIMKQTLDSSLFEVIVVDDGSTDQTDFAIESFLRNCGPKYNLKYFYYPRLTERKHGDSQFRAGIARNIGVKYSSAEYLLFLDSDILLYAHFLEMMLELSKKHGLIQTKRLNFENWQPHESFKSIHDKNTLKESDHGFFRPLDEAIWSQFKDRWKFVCTYSLFLKKDLFIQAGCFRKTFTSYGYEDSELGYRLFKLGISFHYNKEAVLHFYPPDTQSEYKNSIKNKRIILCQSGQVFYQSNLDNEVYKNLEWLWGALDLDEKERFTSKIKYTFLSNFTYGLAMRLNQIFMKLYHKSPVAKAYYFLYYQLKNQNSVLRKFMSKINLWTYAK